MKQLIKTISFRANISSEDYNKDNINFKIDSEENKKNVNKTVLIEILKDEDTNEKYFKLIDPKYTYYINKDGIENEYHVQSMPLDDVEPITVDYDDLIKNISYNLGEEDFFWDCIREKKFGKTKQVLLNPNIHGADLNLEDYYYYKFSQEYDFNNGKNNITKSFFDIEVDSIDIIGFSEPDKAEAPVNLWSYYNDYENKIIVGILRNEENPLIKEFEEKDNLDKFKKFIKDKYIIKGFNDIKIVIKFFNKEINLINFFFQVNNFIKPDFIGGWNSASFDTPYLKNRIQKLGYDPNEIMNSKDIPYKYSSYHLDREQDPCENNSYFLNLDYSNWVDYQKIFANLRKSSKRESYSLDSIAEEELGENKIKFKKETTTIKNSPYEDFWEFVEYNIHDTMLLAMLERQNKDLNLIYTLSNLTSTRITHTLKKTVCVKNLARKFYFEMGFVMSDNPNISYGEEKVKNQKPMRGAFVADPNLNAKIGVVINNIISRYIHDHVIDFDFSALYPSVIMAFNIDETTQLGKIIYLNDDNTDISNELADDIICKDEIFFGNKYLDLPDINEMIEIVKEKI